MKLFWIWASGSVDVVKKNSYLELRQPSVSVELNRLCNFERGHQRGTFLWSYLKFGPVVQKEMLFTHNERMMDDGQKSITIAHLSRRQDKTLKSMYANQVKYGSIILCTKVCFCLIPSHNHCWSPTFLKQFWQLQGTDQDLLRSSVFPLIIDIHIYNVLTFHQSVLTLLYSPQLQLMNDHLQDKFLKRKEVVLAPKGTLYVEALEGVLGIQRYWPKT